MGRDQRACPSPKHQREHSDAYRQLSVNAARTLQSFHGSRASGLLLDPPQWLSFSQSPPTACAAETLQPVFGERPVPQRLARTQADEVDRLYAANTEECEGEDLQFRAQSRGWLAIARRRR